jgi:signal peptidase I
LDYYYLISFINEKIDSIQRPLFSDKRFLNFSKVKKGDIVIINSPWNYQNHLIKRCITIRGDPFSIKPSVLTISGEIEEEYLFVKKCIL